MYSPLSAVKGFAFKALNAVAPKSETAEGAPPPAGDGDFDTLLKGMLKPDSANKVSEEELFAGLAYERIHSLKGKEAADKYKTALESAQAALRKPDGYVPQEQAAIKALSSLTADGVLTAEEGNTVYAQAFAGAQLDSNTGALFDNRGGPNDPTMAVAAMEAALITAKALVTGFDDKSKTAEPRSLTGAAPTGTRGVGAPTTPVNSTVPTSGAGAPVTPSGQTIDGSGGFLWKPESVNQGKLAVLLPPDLTGSINALKILDANGAVVEEGRFTSDGTGEGGRTKYSFNRTGAEYGDNLSVQVELADGTVRTWSIPDGSKRYD